MLRTSAREFIGGGLGVPEASLPRVGPRGAVDSVMDIKLSGGPRASVPLAMARE